MSPSQKDNATVFLLDNIALNLASGGGIHDLLSPSHPDTVPSFVLRGSLIVGDSTPLWSQFPIGEGDMVLRSNGSDPIWAKLALNTDVIGTLAIVNGGTNSSTALNNNRIMVSSGGKIVEATALTNGQLLIGSTGAAPVAASLIAGANITITPGAGSITIAAVIPAVAHTILDAVVHTDSVTQAVVRGSLIYGNSTPKWDRLAIGAAGTVLTSDGADVLWASPAIPGGFTGFGNPSALVGLTPVNGVATTAMRSDGAPAIDQAIVPTWTGTHTFTASTTVFGSAVNALNAIQIVPPAASGSNMVDLFSDGGPGYNAIRKYFSSPFQVEIASSGSIDFVTDSNGNETGATVKFLTNALRGGAQITLFTFNDNGSLVITPTAANAIKIDPFGAAAGNTSEVRYLELVANGTNYTGFKAADSMAASEIYVLPNAAPSANRFLRAGAVAAGVSTLSWAQISLTADVTGVLPVANGGSGVTTAFTLGSVIFAGASGTYAEDNANFFWDDTNNRLGLGVAAPLARLQVANSDAATIGVIVKAAAAQSANIMEWQNSSAVSLVSIASTGAIRVPELSVSNFGAGGVSIKFSNGVMSILETPAGAPIIRFIGNGDFIRMGKDITLAWASTSNPEGSVGDTFLGRASARVLNTPGSIQLSPFGAVAGNTGEVRFLELAAGGTNYTGFKAPDAITASEIYVLPTAAPAANRFLQAAAVAGGVSALSWAQVSLTADVTGILPVANGGSGTSTAFTAGSVIFAGVAGVFSQDNANLFYDDAANRLTVNQVNLPNTSSATVGGIYFGGFSFINNFGTNNFFAGNNSGNFTLTGTSNVAIGLNTLSVNTTGSGNIALGMGSLSANTTGNNNSALAQSGLASNTTGSNNMAIGLNALFSNTIGDSNVGIGLNTLFANTSGINNVAIGSGALDANTTGFSNTAIGVGSLSSNIVGINNSAIGGNVLNANTGDNNVGIGLNALIFNTTGSGNIAIGVAAGDNLTTGSNNIIIGFDINSPTATNSNTLTIGNLLFGTAIDGTGTTLSSGNIGIGVITPLAKLHVTNSAAATVATIIKAAAAQSANLTEWQDSSAVVNTSINAAGNINIPTTTATVGIVFQNAVRFIHTFGTANLFIGSLAGNFTMTGAGVNVGIGFQALQNNTTGSANMAVGGNALMSNTTGSSNVAIGSNALFTNSTGQSNMAIGANALKLNLTGIENVGIGTNALLNTTGSNNTAIGFQALVFNTSGANAVAIGTNALLSVTTGSNNIGLGFQAGDNLTTGANNIALGHNIDSPTATNSNTLTIGNLIFGTGIDGTGTAISSGNVGIAVITPLDRLHIISGGHIRLGNAAVLATPIPTHTLTLKDSTGTTYRIPCVV